MHFSEQVTSVLMEGVRMEENGNCNVSIAKENTREGSTIGFSFPHYAFIVNLVLRSSMVYYLNHSLMVALLNKWYLCKKSMQEWGEMLENS